MPTTKAETEMSSESTSSEPTVESCLAELREMAVLFQLIVCVDGAKEKWWITVQGIPKGTGDTLSEAMSQVRTDAAEETEKG